MADRFDPRVWTSKDGTSCAITDLEDRHLFNILKFLFGLPESHIRQAAKSLASDMERSYGPNERSAKLARLSLLGSERDIRVAYTPQIPLLEAEAEIRGIEGWRYTLPERDIRNTINSVVSDAASLVRVFDSIRHSPNVPVKKELKSLRASLRLLEGADFRIGA